MKMSSQHMAKNVYCQNKELSSLWWRVRWRRRRRRGAAKENQGGVEQSKGRNNCSGHRFTSGSAVLFWPGGGPAPLLTIKGVSRLTGIFQRPAERKTHSGTFKTVIWICLARLALQMALHFMLILDVFSRILNYDMPLRFTHLDWSHYVVKVTTVIWEKQTRSP